MGPVPPTMPQGVPPVVVPIVAVPPDFGAPAGPAAAPAFELRHDVPCIECGYNLRGLSGDGLCPECGTPVLRSLQKNYLSVSNPAWVRSLETSANLMLWVLVLYVLAILAGLAADAVALGVGLVAAAVQVAAQWKLTTPEPAERPLSPLTRTRGRLRVFVVLSFAAGAAQLLPDVFPSRTLSLILQAAELVNVPLVFLLYGYLRHLALRVPHRGLASGARAVAWGFTLSLAVGDVAGFFPALASAPGGTLVLAGVMIAAGLGLLVFGVWALVLLFRFRAAFSRAYLDAAINWDRPPVVAPAAFPPIVP